MTNCFEIPKALSSAVARILVDSGCVRIEDTTLTTGRHAPYYINLREVSALPEVNVAICRELAAIVNCLEAEAIMGIPDASNLLAMTTGLVGESAIPVLRMPKELGKEQLYGSSHLHAGASVVVIDDVISDGGSKIKPVRQLSAMGYLVTAIVVVVNRCEGGADFILNREQVPVIALCTIHDILEELSAQSRITPEQRQQIEAYIREANFQSPTTSS